jgi:hypothetical protein
MVKNTVAQDDRRRRDRLVLTEAVERFNNDNMDDEERQLLLDRIKRLRKALAA